MSRPKKRIGLQKDFSKIFDGVWVPQRPGREQFEADKVVQDQSPAGETPVSDEKGPDVETPAPTKQEPRTRDATSEGHNSTVEIPASKEAHRAGGGPNPAKQGQNGDTATLREHYREIEKIMTSMKCAKDFVCYRSGLTDLCKVTTVGEGKVIECSPENRGPCVYRFSFAGRIFCKCALRYYIARNLNR
ncbi:MAG: hypothetical protein JXN61_17585 [Sedimentisphaerales bacterium]|nr:hypothetical protein [Sedimentisphaerales bacterium]